MFFKFPNNMSARARLKFWVFEMLGLGGGSVY